MLYSVHAVYAPNYATKVFVARIESETEISAERAFVAYVKKRAKQDGRKFAKNYTLKKDSKKDASLTVFTIGSNVLNGISLYLVRGSDIQNGETIGKIVLPKLLKKKAKK